MSDWFPLHAHSHDSLLDGLSKPGQIAARLAQCGLGGCALTDHGTIAGVPGFLEAMGKKGLKAIAGCEFNVCRGDAVDRSPENEDYVHLCVLARGEAGWRNLIRATSAANDPAHFYRRPRLDLARLGALAGGEWIVFSGHMGSALASILFSEPKRAYAARSYEEARALLRRDWKSAVFAEVERHQAAFGKDNFYLEIQLVDADNLPAALFVANALRWVGKEMGVPRVATADSHYPAREDAPDQRILLCSALRTTLKQVQKKLDCGEDVGLGTFFRSNRYHIPLPEEMRALHREYPDELANSVEIADRCQPFSLSRRPLLPAFECPPGRTPDSYLEHLCRKGWARKIAGTVSTGQAAYRDQVKKELAVLTGAGLSSYFLIVEDYTRYAVENLGCRVGEGRGSAAGCLVSYLLGITNVDPVKYDLLFERFYNAGRNDLKSGRVALPDIDSDFPVNKREPVIDYVRRKYGADKVCHMATYARMQGRGALKDVLSAHERCSFEEMNRITEFIPDEAEIADELQEMAEAGEEPSIIRWALENTPGPLREWCHLDDDGEPEGPLALDFAQAMRLEGTKRSQGRHASGIIISSVTLADIVPMTYDRSNGQPIVCVDMKAAEDMGLVKFDILGTAVLDKIMDAESVIRTGSLPD